MVFLGPASIDGECQDLWGRQGREEPKEKQPEKEENLETGVSWGSKEKRASKRRAVSSVKSTDKHALRICKPVALEVSKVQP